MNLRKYFQLFHSISIVFFPHNYILQTISLFSSNFLVFTFQINRPTFKTENLYRNCSNKKPFTQQNGKHRMSYKMYRMNSISFGVYFSILLLWCWVSCRQSNSPWFFKHSFSYSLHKIYDQLIHSSKFHLLGTLHDILWSVITTWSEFFFPIKVHIGNSKYVNSMACHRHFEKHIIHMTNRLNAIQCYINIAPFYFYWPCSIKTLLTSLWLYAPLHMRNLWLILAW